MSEQEQQAPADARPEGLPGAFTDVPALVRSLKDTQAALTRAKQAAPPKDAPAAPVVAAAEDKPEAPHEATEEGEQEAPDPELAQEEAQAEINPAEASPDQAQEMLAKNGLDLAELTDEWSRNGNNLTEATYERLAQAGVTREAVALFAEGRYAVAAQIVNEVHSMVGGEQGWQELAQWAARTLPAPERAAIDQLLSGNTTQRQLAITALKAKFEQEHGREGTLIHGQGSIADTGFGSMMDAIEAMGVRDAKGRERYAVDPEYRKQVERKIAKMRR